MKMKNKIKLEINLEFKNSECACFLPLGEMSKGQRGITRSTKKKVKKKVKKQFPISKTQNVLVSSPWGKCPKDKGGLHVAPKKMRNKMNSNSKLISNSETRTYLFPPFGGNVRRTKGDHT
jgi:hypothetical protein